ncbi:hypothetical protein K2173_012915 (mitochondrion) [Erythroxylum novogranatense]|uniref:Uncharacterized protein n=1 Tax=Erythroxylum novogranatense TaxID=1862640 RepID=A0AAV8S455_9ROSI|nr:hypothetical protein K2173_012915 [Erythroxylum novogranatense]
MKTDGQQEWLFLLLEEGSLGAKGMLKEGVTLRLRKVAKGGGEDRKDTRLVGEEEEITAGQPVKSRKERKRAAESVGPGLQGEGASASGRADPTDGVSPSSIGEKVDSGSESWKKYLNLSSSSDKEGNLAPEPSTSSTWIEKWLSPEVSSSAPDDQGPRQKGEGALFQPPLFRSPTTKMY